MKELYSRSGDGLSVVTVEFHESVDADRKDDEVLREVNALRPELPRRCSGSMCTRNESNTVAIMQVALVSETTPFHELDGSPSASRSASSAWPACVTPTAGVRPSARWR